MSSNIKQHSHGYEELNNLPWWKPHWELLAALFILITLLIIEYGFGIILPNIPLLVINLAAYFLAGRNVLLLALRKSMRGDVFNEFVLMSIATIGAYIISITHAIFLHKL